MLNLRAPDSNYNSQHYISSIIPNKKDVLSIEVKAGQVIKDFFNRIITSDQEQMKTDFSPYEAKTIKLPPNLPLDFDFEKARQEHTYIKYSTPTLSGEFFRLQTKKIQTNTNDTQVVKDFNTVFDARKFLEPRMPVVIGSVEDQETFDSWGIPRCIHLPIKLPGSDIRIPIEYKQFSKAIEQIMNHEFSVNPDFQKPYYYLTVDQSFIPKGGSQRIVFAHVDGIPRDRETITQITDHAYLITNSISTKFYVHPFDLDKYDMNKHNFFEIMNRTIDESKTILSKPYEMTLMGAYNVHTAITTNEDIFRTFIRVEASILDFDREGNSVNPAFFETNFVSYPFKYRQRRIPDQLVVPEELKTQEEIEKEKRGLQENFYDKWYVKNPDIKR